MYLHVIKKFWWVAICWWDAALPKNLNPTMLLRIKGIKGPCMYMCAETSTFC